IAGSPTQVFGYNDDFTTISGTTGLATGYPGGSSTVDIDVDLGGVVFFNRDHTWDANRGQGGAGNAGGGGLWNGGGAGGGNGSTGGGGANENAQESAGGGAIGVENGSRLALGGGGGSGGQTDLVNDGFPEDVNSGRPGGGAVLIRADVFESTGTTGVINANGDDGNTFNATANPSAPDEDGSGGGGGAGGTVIVVTSSEDLSDLTINTSGGDGAGLTGIQQYLSPDGGGGGGAGGSVMLVRRGGDFSATPTIDVSGGAAGATQGTPSENSTGGTGAVTLLTTPPAANLDCPLITLAAPAPGGVPGSIIWFNPDENVTYNGSQQVSSWNDFSASNFTLTNTAVSGITGTTPDYIAGSFTGAEGSSNANFNFNPSISFNEGADQDDYLAFANFTNISTAAITTFAVVHIPASTANDQTIYSYLPNDVQDDELDLGISNDGGADGIRKQTLDDPADRAGDLRDGITRIIATDYDNTDVNIYLNNGTATNVVQSAGTLDVGGTFVLGQDLDDFTTPAFDNTRVLQGQLGDVMYFSRIITDTERQQVSSFLAIKYGITLDQTTDQDYLNSIGEAIYPVVTETASYAAYDNDIAGIGRDDGSRLSQLRSKSINSDAIITGSHTDGFAVDRQFVVWGNNDGGTTFNTTEISTGITNRIQREWRVAVANSPNPVDFSFDLSGTTSTPAVSANLALVIDDDGDFSNGFLRTVSANSWDGSTATFDNVTLNDDEVFTVAEVPETPGGVSNLTLWLKVDAGLSETGGSVSAWADQSGNSNDATSGNNPTLIADAINSYGVVDFDGTNDNMDGAAGFNTQSYFIVAQPDVAVDGTANGFVLGFETGGSTFSGFLLGTNVDGYVPSDRIVHVVGTNGDGDEYRSGRPDGTFTALDEPVIYSSANNTGATVQDIFSNGADINPEQYANALKNLTDEPYRLGNNYANSNFYDGGIAEVLSYSTALSTTEREKIQSYLAIKYGITLDGDETDYIASDGNYIYETVIAPANYNNDIAGIGRDDISQLDQRKSLSVNADAIVTMALTDNAGTFASPNAATANLSFLAWGNDNDDDGTIEDITTEVPSNVVTRLDREWRVQEIGTIGNVTMEIDISGVTPNGGGDFTGSNAANFLLLIDDGGDFSNGITRSVDPASYDAVNEILTFDVDFVDGDIFTVATSLAPNGPGGVTNNLSLWLKSNEGVTSVGGDGTEVTNWADQSGNGLDFASQVFSPGETQIGPTLVNSDPNFNDNPSFTFTDNYLARDPFNSFPGTDLSAIIVSRPDLTATGNNQALLSYGAEVFQLRSLDNLLIEYNNGNNTIGLDILGFTNILSIAADDLNDETNIFLNGVADAGNPNGTTLAGFANNDEFVIGYDSDSDQSLDNNEEFVGSVAEVILYNSELTDTERTRIESYLAIKYGITLNGGDYDYESADGTIFFPGNSDTDFASFRTDVAGIGRDDNSDYEQLTSSSINSTAVLSIAKNAVFGGSDQYVAWAHNGTVITASAATDFPSGTEGRLDRAWKIKLTNAPSGTIDMTFDLTGVNVDNAADLRIIVDADGDFSDATLLSPTVVQNGNSYTFSNIDLSDFTDGSFFTVASIDNADTPLPLDFLSFVVNEVGGNSLLKWTTTNEVNVDRFEIERSGNGVDFEEIGQLKANNKSDGINAYEFSDTHPLNQVNYYRIKQVDFDGAFEHTRIEFVIIDGGKWEVNVYPNPTTDMLNIATTLRTSGRMKVVDMFGKVVMDYPTVNDRVNSMDVSNLKTGVYQLEFNSVLGVQRVRFIKK
ncbi:MAG: T9SS type A sorting domain-containing protein, partial [Ekhidna sp.]